MERDARKGQDKDLFTKPPDAGARFAERRSVPRYAFVAAVDLFEPVSRTSFQGRTTEIGTRGCYLDMMNPLPVHTVVQIRIHRETGTFETWGTVAYAQKGLGMGLVFLKTLPEQEKIVEAWIAELNPS
jgi:hypothetical protein